MMTYQLYDSDGKLVADAKGPGLQSGVLTVNDVNPWWPIGMSDAPGYLYKLKVRTMLVEAGSGIGHLSSPISGRLL
jgi:beta-galactosidase/beta-glucuronidase